MFTWVRTTSLLVWMVSQAVVSQPLAQSEELPPSSEVEQALADQRSARNPTFVEYKTVETGRALVVGVPYSPQRVNDDLINDFESTYDVLRARKWLGHFVEVHLVVPQPLMKVRVTVDDIRKLHATELSKAEFQQRWRTEKLGPS
jgi:hypothetical protein